jgi:tRNA A-37 threonylcarbamoyl transferase component Bud32
LKLAQREEEKYTRFATSLFKIEGGPWRQNRVLKKSEPIQGWKLHVSATIINALQVLNKCCPIILHYDIPSKIPKSLNILQALNSGSYGYSQVGKFMTIYCRSDREALSIANDLHQVTKEYHSPKVPYDMPFASNGIIYYRYGLFQNFHKKKKLRGLLHPTGKIVSDSRAPHKAIPKWVTNPFYQWENTEHYKALIELGYLVYECLFQRGKGGIYRAIDMNSTLPRRCIIKEGRKYGEVTYDRKDGQDRIINEYRCLKKFTSIGIPVPKVYDIFSMNDCTCLVLEEIGGSNMQNLLRKKSLRCSMFHYLKWMTKMAEYVGLIHKSGKIWRDCKPGNFMVDDSMTTIRPIDFEGTCNLGDCGLIPWATPGYCPPHYENNHKRTKRDFDLYSLGASFYHIITKKNPPAHGKLTWNSNFGTKLPIGLKNMIEDLLSGDLDRQPEAFTVSKKLMSYY